MAHRVISSEVKLIIDTDLTDSEISSFIETANMVVDEVLSDSTVLSTRQLKEIEKYLSAHFICVREGQAMAEGADAGNITYTRQKGKGLESTSYGQTAMALDETGTLGAEVGKKDISIVAVTEFD